MSGRIVLVTGGSRGIGRAIAERFAALGDRVIASARQAPRTPLAAGIEFAACDVADPTAVARLFRHIGETHGRLDVLVNNAGIAGSNRLDGDDELWHRILATNLDGSYFCSKAALALLPDSTGRIINIASVLGLFGVADQTAYCAAKHGVVGLTRALAKALGPRRITVNAVCPGWVRTDMATERFAELGIGEAEAAMDSATGRITEPAEVAALVAFLASAEAANITGQALPIDGG